MGYLFQRMMGEYYPFMKNIENRNLGPIQEMVHSLIFLTEFRIYRLFRDFSLTD